MTLPTTGITQEVIRDIMPPYRLSADLLSATVAALPPPPPNATTAWRHARLTRLLEEVAAARPADAGQARIATQLLTIRELADSFTARAHTQDLEFNQICRAARTAAELLRSANALERTLNRQQQKPVPFYGTVIQDEVDIQALDAQWAGTPAAASTQPPVTARRPNREPPPHSNPPHKPTTHTTPPPATPTPDATPPSPAIAAPRPDTAPPPPAARHAALPTPTAPPETSARPVPPPEPPAQPSPPPAPHTRPAAPNSDWSITQLDSGPGWSREVLRHRSATQTEAAE